MGLIDSLKEALVPQTERGVRYECVECGTQFDTARERCPECESTEIKEVEGFELRPSS